MELQEAVLRVQTGYPRIYLACHSRHQNARTTANHLSQRDGTLLNTTSKLRAHPLPSPQMKRLGVADSLTVAARIWGTLSELAIEGLELLAHAARPGFS